MKLTRLRYASRISPLDQRASSARARRIWRHLAPSPRGSRRRRNPGSSKPASCMVTVLPPRGAPPRSRWTAAAASACVSTPACSRKRRSSEASTAVTSAGETASSGVRRTRRVIDAALVEISPCRSAGPPPTAAILHARRGTSEARRRDGAERAGRHAAWNTARPRRRWGPAEHRVGRLDPSPAARKRPAWISARCIPHGAPMARTGGGAERVERALRKAGHEPSVDSPRGVDSPPRPRPRCQAPAGRSLTTTRIMSACASTARRTRTMSPRLQRPVRGADRHQRADDAITPRAARAADGARFHRDPRLPAPSCVTVGSSAAAGGEARPAARPPPSQGAGTSANAPWSRRRPASLVLAAELLGPARPRRWPP